MQETAEDRARQVMASSRFFRIHMFEFQKQESDDAHRDECKWLWSRETGFSGRLLLLHDRCGRLS